MIDAKSDQYWLVVAVEAYKAHRDEAYSLKYGG